MPTTTLAAALLAATLTAVTGCGDARPPERTGPPAADPAPGSGADRRPNILLIVADDLGYTDLGAFGGEIATPNLDALATSGVRLTNFHANASCAPTRAMLLTGTDNHLAGLGSQSGLATPEQRKHPQYRNELSPGVKTVARRLGDAGYRTYASAKWHLGGDAPQLPGNRGFDRSLVLLEGGGGHFDDTALIERHGKAHWLLDDAPLTLPDDFYSTTYMTDRIMEFIGDDARQDQPFFAYLGYTAPHWPLQAPDAWLQKYRGRYDAGYDALMQARMAGARAQGVVPEAARAVTDNAGVVPWAALSADEQRGYTARMEAYAAMVDLMDVEVGRLIRFLSDSGVLDNTLIVFMSDNGAEGHAMEFRADWKAWLDRTFDNTLENIGRRTSYVTLGAGWARATAAPFRASKSKVSEGGIRVPAFVRLPRETVPTTMAAATDNAFMTVVDITPTLLEAAGVEGDEQIRGRSLLTRLRGGDAPVYGADEAFAWELYGRRAVHMGPWKLLLQEPPFGTGEWQLYNLDADLGEQVDVSAEYPRLFEDLRQRWHAYAEEVGVVLPEHPIAY